MTVARISIFIALGLGGNLRGDAGDNSLSSEEKAAGWKLLFDGKAAPGLRGLQKPDFLRAGWEIQEGALVLTKSIKQSGNVTGGDLVTVEQFTDFEFSFDFKFTASACGGVVYFARSGTGGKPSGHEYQIIDDMHHPDGLKGGPLRRTGALYGVLPPGEEKKLNASDTWNSGAILVRGNHVEHWLNGQQVLAYECGSPALTQAVRANKAKVPTSFGLKSKAPLVILDKGEEIAFRNLKIRPIVAAPATPKPAPPAPATPVPMVPPVEMPAPTLTNLPVAPAPVEVTATPMPTILPKTNWTLPPPPPPPVLRP